MKKIKNKFRNLSKKELSSIGVGKVLIQENDSLKKSLEITQNELEGYRAKYHESDKNYAVQVSKNKIIIFHEILKYATSVLFGGIGVNYLTSGNYLFGGVLVLISLIFYTLIVLSDRK